MPTESSFSSQDGSMRCPFLREAQVKSCQASAFRKMILRSAVVASEERCLSSEYVHCPAAKQRHEEVVSSRCPFLQESLMQYCSAAPVAKYIPYTESLQSRCASGRHRSCESYLNLSHPPHPGTDGIEGDIAAGLPEDVYLAKNHLWMKVHADGTFLIGIDALLARVLGGVEKVTFLASRGMARPSAVLTVRGMDLQVMFPNPVTVSGTNALLRTSPERLTADPYARGWMFEGMAPHGGDHVDGPFTEGLLRGDEARAWLRKDIDHLTLFVHDRSASQEVGGRPVMNDGGEIAPDLLAHLTREEVLHLFSEFFSPYASLRR